LLATAVEVARKSRREEKGEIENGGRGDGRRRVTHSRRFQFKKSEI
jgi:hypothetical protein